MIRPLIRGLRGAGQTYVMSCGPEREDRATSRPEPERLRDALFDLVLPVTQNSVAGSDLVALP